MIRDLNLHDLVVMENEAKFPLPNINSPLFCVRKSLIINDELIASFWVKLTSETSIVIRGSKLEKTRAILEIHKFLNSELRRLGLEDNHVFISDTPEYVKILMKHFKFEKIVGEPLVLRRQDG